jgi:hypothetical protein
LVTVALPQTETHVDAVGLHGIGHPADIAMASFAILTGGDVGEMSKVDKVGEVHYPPPEQRLLVFPDLQELLYYFLAFLAGHCNILVAAHAFVR